MTLLSKILARVPDITVSPSPGTGATNDGNRILAVLVLVTLACLFLGWVFTRGSGRRPPGKHDW
jgi:hypothetical protein